MREEDKELIKRLAERLDESKSKFNSINETLYNYGEKNCDQGYQSNHIEFANRYVEYGFNFGIMVGIVIGIVIGFTLGCWFCYIQWL